MGVNKGETPMIKADMRYIHFRQEPKPHYSSKRLLCDHCGRQSRCPDEAGNRDRWTQIKTCDAFMPVLAFKPPHVGMETEFNTFRMGPAWTKRVAPGSLVGLLDTQTQSVFAQATVQRVIAGQREEMAHAHGYMNHLEISHGSSDRAESAERTLKALRRLYGNLIYTNNPSVTVIYLKPHAPPS